MRIPEEKNVALWGRATQSSRYSRKGEANHAIDGKKSTNYFSGACSSTKKVFGPWWRLELEKSFNISAIAITNRGDCCPERLQGAVIRVGNSLYINGNAICGTVTSTVAGATQTFCCNGIEGRYVSISIPGRSEYLSLCEVEVMGIPSVEQCVRLPNADTTVKPSHPLQGSFSRYHGQTQPLLTRQLQLAESNHSTWLVRNGTPKKESSLPE
nr:PREDICTED: fucolectin-like [Latimeria chalumnae]|eukprot:XP_014354456.1 PREDICTED: fucolectin-like [Latimeria chalumnae]